jgi:hypothetical protein
MNLWAASLLVLTVWATSTSGPLAQAPGIAEITRPVNGEAVRGVVTLEGTANHPAFDRFDLAFAYDVDSTETWFPIVDEDRSRVVEGRLAVWDTNGVTDGEYTLRLRVWPIDGDPLVTVVRGVRVRNYTGVETPTPGPSSEAPVATATVAPATATPVAPAAVAEAPESGTRVGDALVAGGLLAIGVLAAAGIYTARRANSRSEWGSARAARRVGRRRRPGPPT